MTASATAKIAAPINATVTRPESASDSPASNATATSGSNRFASWFQIPVSVTARATAAVGNAHERSSANEPAIPTRPPPGNDVGHRRGGLGERERATELQSGQRDHPRWCERDHVERRREHERHDRSAVDRREHLPHVAVIRDPRQHHAEGDAADDKPDERAQVALVTLDERHQPSRPAPRRTIESSRLSGNTPTAARRVDAVLELIAPSCSAWSAAWMRPRRSELSSSS